MDFGVASAVKTQLDNFPRGHARAGRRRPAGSGSVTTAFFTGERHLFRRFLLDRADPRRRAVELEYRRPSDSRRSSPAGCVRVFNLATTSQLLLLIAICRSSISKVAGDVGITYGRHIAALHPWSGALNDPNTDTRTRS